MKIGPFEEIFEAIVAENGAVVHFVTSDTITLPFGTIDLALIQQTEAEKIPIDRGLAIAATWKPYDKAIIKILTQTGFPASLEYNRDAVMLLPLGATKGTGLITALQELARLIKKIENRHLDNESLKDLLVETVNTRFAELQTLL